MHKFSLALSFMLAQIYLHLYDMFELYIGGCYLCSLWIVGSLISPSIGQYSAYSVIELKLVMVSQYNY